VEVAENLLQQGGYMRPREVAAIVAGTRTKSGSTNFLRLHVMGDYNQERFFATHQNERFPEPNPAAGLKRAAQRSSKSARKTPTT
jgi:pyruvate kinase